MIRWLRQHRVIAYLVAAILLFGLAAGLGAVGALMVQGDLRLPAGEGSRPPDEQQNAPRPQETDAATQQEEAARREEAARQEEAARREEAEYLARVGEIQAGSVEAFFGSDEKLLRPDSLTAADVEDMEENIAALRKYADRVEALEPPERYADQRELLAAAVDDLHGAAEIAYRLVTDPASATQADYDTYDLLADRATTSLRRSNEILGEDYETIERAQGDGR